MPDPPQVAAEQCIRLGASGIAFESFPTREVRLGDLPVARALPVRDRRLVGPWCFLDRFGPLTFADGKPMDVAPHPHTGLQTVTWLLDGEIAHDDSLGCEAILRPDGVNVMTSGRGIAHAEQTPPQNTQRLNGVQLWVALPDAHRHGDPHFQAIAQVAVAEPRGGIVRAFAGSLAGAASPARHFSPLVGADIEIHPGEQLELPINPDFEHAVLILAGDSALEGRPLPERQFHYLGLQRASLPLSSRGGGRILLIGGPPFPETILMWWNFVARTPEEIAQARADWEDHRRFGEVPAYHGPRLAAPSLVRIARPEAMS